MSGDILGCTLLRDIVRQHHPGHGQGQSGAIQIPSLRYRVGSHIQKQLSELHKEGPETSWAELGQAQLKLGLNFNSTRLISIVSNPFNGVVFIVIFRMRSKTVLSKNILSRIIFLAKTILGLKKFQFQKKFGSKKF